MIWKAGQRLTRSEVGRGIESKMDFRHQDGTIIPRSCLWSRPKRVSLSDYISVFIGINPSFPGEGVQVSITVFLIESLDLGPLIDKSITIAITVILMNVTDNAADLGGKGGGENEYSSFSYLSLLEVSSLSERYVTFAWFSVKSSRRWCGTTRRTLLISLLSDTLDRPRNFVAKPFRRQAIT